MIDRIVRMFVATEGARVDLDGLPGRLRNLEKAAFKDFSDYFGPRFFRLFVSAGLQPYQAEDLATICVSDICMKIHAYRRLDGTPFQNWVFSIARNKLADWWIKAVADKTGISDFAHFGRPDQEIH